MVFLIPAALLVVLVVGYPILRTAGLSLFRYGLATGFSPEWAGFDNFVRAAFDSRFRNSLRITAFFTLVSVALEFGLGLFLAFAADSLHRGRGLVRAMLLVPWTLPTAIIGVLWTWIFNDQYGILNAALRGAHLTEAGIPWLARPGPAMAALITADVWKTFPFVFVILLAGLQSIPRELYESMEMDGGGAWPKFRHVTWPHLVPFVYVAVVFRGIQAFAAFDLMYVMTGGGPGGATETVSVYAYQTYMRYLDFGYGCALVVVMVLVLAALATGLHLILLRGHERAR
ncbi:MAG: sugar ABC transporter permease [Acidobacteria bacterium]|nr:sugar ABC transporter permease [Acidobacteriota bacterium]